MLRTHWNDWYFSHFRIDTTNNILDSEVEGVSSPTGAQLQCTFLSGFTGSAHCTVQYGTDPTYMNLPYSAESNDTGRAGNTVIVVLRERLNSSTVYYYTVSAVSGDDTVTVQGTFMTPQYSMGYTCTTYISSCCMGSFYIKSNNVETMCGSPG